MKCLWPIFGFFIFSPYRINTPRKQGGLGNMKIPLVADLNKTISKDYGVLKQDDGIAYRSGERLKSLKQKARGHCARGLSLIKWCRSESLSLE